MKRIGLAIILSLVFAGPSQAVPVTIDFTVTLRSDYGAFAAGTAGTGFFTYDDEIFASIAPNADGSREYDDSDYSSPLLPIDLEFAWLGTLWDEASVGLSALVLDADGTLQSWGLGGLVDSCQNAAPVTSCVADVPVTDFIMSADLNAERTTIMHLDGLAGHAFGNIQSQLDGGWSVRSEPTPVPESGTLALLASALAALLLMRRRSRLGRLNVRLAS